MWFKTKLIICKLRLSTAVYQSWSRPWRTVNYRMRSRWTRWTRDCRRKPRWPASTKARTNGSRYACFYGYPIMTSYDIIILLLWLPTWLWSRTYIVALLHGCDCDVVQFLRGVAIVTRLWRHPIHCGVAMVMLLWRHTLRWSCVAVFAPFWRCTISYSDF